MIWEADQGSEADVQAYRHLFRQIQSQNRDEFGNPGLDEGLEGLSWGMVSMMDVGCTWDFLLEKMSQMLRSQDDGGPSAGLRGV